MLAKMKEKQRQLYTKFTKRVVPREIELATNKWRVEHLFGFCTKSQMPKIVSEETS